MESKYRWLTGAILGSAATFMISSTAMAQGMGPRGWHGHHGDVGNHHMMRHMHADDGDHMMMRQSRRGMRRGMMGPMHTRDGRRPGAAQIFGGRVSPRMNLSVDDVRYHLEQRLERLGNERLKVGSVKEKDKETIVADVVTVDDSLVQAIEVNRQTGEISYGK